MMTDMERFPFSEKDEIFGVASSLPYLPLTFTYRNRSVSVSGLLDTGASVNVLPYDMGIQLGADWKRQKMPVRLTGNLAQLEARVLIVSAKVGQFAPVRLTLAWTQANNIPLILGQVNFFMEFDVCFFRSQSVFEISPKQSQ